MRIKLADIFDKSILFYVTSFGELTAWIIDDRVKFVNSFGTVKLMCDLDSRFDVYTDEHGDYIKFETQAHTHKVYPIRREFIKLKD